MTRSETPKKIKKRDHDIEKPENDIAAAERFGVGCEAGVLLVGVSK